VEEQLAGGPGGSVTPALIVDIDQELVRVREALTATRAGSQP
jgi:hypothetical protein